MILHQVITTEKVPFTYRVAGLGSRFLAWFVDITFVLLLCGVGGFFFLALEARRAGLGSAFMGLWVFALHWGYFLVFEWFWQGQTPGKRLLGIRVIDAQGTGLSFLQAAVRSVLRVVDGLPVPFLLYGVGFAVAACNREGRRFGDLAAGTLVVHVERRPTPVQALTEARTEADRARLTQVRQRLGQLDRPQKQAILDLCLRRDQLRVADRTRLFHAAAEYCRNHLDLAPAEFQSEEKFVLELAAVLGERGLAESEPAPSRIPARR